MQSADLPIIVKNKLLSLGAAPGDPFLVAFSGGQDSTALLLAMIDAAESDGSLTAAHLDHAAHPASEENAVKVLELCQHLGIECIQSRLDEVELETQRRSFGSLEAAMRELRYRFLEQAARDSGSRWILTGHTADDQAETILFRILRGMDWRSLVSIPERRGNILRPLIGIRRRRTMEFCSERSVDPVSDPSNENNGFSRNMVRNRLLPELARSFNKDLASLVLRLGQSAGRLAEAERVLLSAFTAEPGCGDYPGISASGLLSLPAVLQRGVLVDFMYRNLSRYPSSGLVDDVLKFLLAGKNGQLRLPDDRVLFLSYGTVSVGEIKDIGHGGLPTAPVQLRVPGKAYFPSEKITISSKEITLETPGSYPRGRTVLISKKAVRGSLWVRKRLPGDIFTPLGMERSKKLQDFMVDRKIPISTRDRIPLVLNGKEEILWVAGIEISSKAALEGIESEEAVELRFESRSDDEIPAWR